MFNPELFPTPPDVAATMLDPLDLRGRVVVEPSAGTGNLVQAALERGAAEVLMVEPEPKLRAILAGIQGDCRLIGSDWLAVTAEQISHADLVVMNPPFSADERHILHAWAVAPAGCQIVSLCNWSILDSRSYRSLDDRNWRRQQQELRTLIEQYGSSQNLGPVFQDAERTTRCEIGLVRLTKPGQRVSGADEFDGFFFGPDDIEAQGEGLIRYRRSRDLVNRYVEACRIYDQQLEAGVRLQAQVGGIYKGELGLQITMEGCAANRNRFRKELQKSFWESVIAEMLPREMATSQLAGDINKFVEQQTKVPFTERNLFRMLQVIAGTTEQRIDRAVEAAFDELTRHTAENRWNVEGWKTNDAYLFNQKFIVPYIAEPDWSGGTVSMRYGGNKSRVEDLVKALCYITGRPYAEVEKPDRPGGFDRMESGVWYDWGFFEFKVFKKGTGHFRFKDLEDWAALNARVARIKGLVLPEKLRRKSTRKTKR
jgi:16S rRNA G966 N2-methylase RsmD